MSLQTRTRRRRPFGVYVVMVLLLLQNLTVVVSDDEVRFGLTSVLPADSDTRAALNVLSVVLAVALLMVVVGLWRMQRWAWVATMVLIGAGLAVSIVLYFRGQALYWTMIIDVATVFYLNQRDVQDAFERRRPRELRA